MIEIKPEDGTITSLMPLSTVRDANKLYQQRRDICLLAFPHREGLIVRQGKAYPLRHAQLVLIGEVYEYAEIRLCTGLVRSQKLRTLPMGSIIFPQALNEHLASQPSLCEYRAGENVKLLTLNMSVMELLGFSEAAVSHIAHTEARLIKTLIELVEAQEDDLAYANNDRMQALEEISRKNAEIQSLRASLEQREKDIACLTATCNDIEQQLELATSPSALTELFESENLENLISADILSTLEEQAVTQVALEIPSQDPEITYEETDPEQSRETQISEHGSSVEDLSPEDFQEVPEDDEFFTRPTLRPPPEAIPQTSLTTSAERVTSNDEEEPRRDTWTNFLAAPRIEDPEQDGQRQTFVGVAPPPPTSDKERVPPSTIRRGYVVPSIKKP